MCYPSFSLSGCSSKWMASITKQLSSIASSGSKVCMLSPTLMLSVHFIYTPKYTEW
uniref:Uncharacterized protein n=1 Tax=Triticum urartu TaxID=4572 RepID=A0A8R7PKI5_TRIUA